MSCLEVKSWTQVLVEAASMQVGWLGRKSCPWTQWKKEAWRASGEPRSHRFWFFHWLTDSRNTKVSQLGCLCLKPTYQCFKLTIPTTLPHPIYQSQTRTWCSIANPNHAFPWKDLPCTTLISLSIFCQIGVYVSVSGGRVCPWKKAPMGVPVFTSLLPATGLKRSEK